MPNLSDFDSPAVFIQGLLALAAALMAWRGAVLSGDRKRRHTVGWGLTSVATFLLALIVGALGNHDSTESVNAANHRADVSGGQLKDIQRQLVRLTTQNSALGDAMGKIAGKAEIDPNQSAEALSDQIVAKMNSLQSQITTTQTHVSALENPPPDAKKLYQNNLAAGDVIRASIRPDGSVYFQEIDNMRINLSQPVFFRGVEFNCGGGGMQFMFGTSPITHLPTQAEYEDLTCTPAQK